MKTSIWLAVLFLCSLSISAQENFGEMVEMLNSEKDRKKVEKQFQNIFVPMKMPSAYGIDAAFKTDKVGIFTVIILDEKKLLNSSKEPVYWMPGASLADLIGKIYTPALSTIRDQVKGEGITVLTPEEYLTTDELKQAYANIDFKNSNFAKVAGAVGSVVGSTHGAAACPTEEYRIFPPLVMNGQMTNKRGEYQIGALAQKAGLDGMLVVSMHVNTVLDKFGKPACMFYNFKSDYHATNQSPQDPNKKYPKIIGGYPASVKLGYSQFVRGDLVINPREKVKVDGKKIIKETDFSGEVSQVFAHFMTGHLKSAKAAVAKTNEKNKF